MESDRLHHATQAAILIGSGLAMLVLAQPAPLSRWGFVIGMAAQPFFLLASWRAAQWGVFVNAIVYTVALALGIYNNF